MYRSRAVKYITAAGRPEDTLSPDAGVSTAELVGSRMISSKRDMPSHEMNISIVCGMTYKQLVRQRRAQVTAATALGSVAVAGNDANSSRSCNSSEVTHSAQLSASRSDIRKASHILSETKFV